MLDASRYYLFTELMTHDTRLNSRKLPAAQYQLAMLNDEIADLALGHGADRGTIVEQVRRKRGAWTVEALSDFLEVSPKLIYKLVKTGKLNAYRIGTSIRIDGQDAANFLALHATIPQRTLPAKLRSRFPA
jgi:excisionase family DNA binding protein